MQEVVRVCVCVCLCCLSVGRNAPNGNSQTGSVPTDPFMILVSPEERYASSAGVPMASFCDTRDVRTVRFSSRTALTDFCLDRFFWATQFLIFFLIFRFWAVR